MELLIRIIVALPQCRTARLGYGLVTSRRIVPILAVIVVALLAVLVAIYFAEDRDQELAVEPEPTSVEPTVVPTSEPIAWEPSTDLLAVLPDQVLGYAISAEPVAAQANWLTPPLEQWQIDYRSTEEAVTITVAQWQTGEAARAAMDGDPDIAQAAVIGDVVVSGEYVGTALQFSNDDGTERLRWRNNTVVFEVTGPVGSTLPFYNAYPL